MILFYYFFAKHAMEMEWSAIVRVQLREEAIWLTSECHIGQGANKITDRVFSNHPVVSKAFAKSRNPEQERESSLFYQL